MIDGPFQLTTSLSEPASDINTYFVRRKSQKQKTGPLFKFDSSSHPKALNSYLKEHRYSNFSLVVCSWVFKEILSIKSFTKILIL